MHRTHPILSVLLVLAFALVACGDKKDEKKAGDGAGQTDPAETKAGNTDTKAAKAGADDASGPFARYGVADIATKWQGAWTLSGSSLGQTVAWNVAGDKVTEWDGSAEKTMDFEVIAPCSSTTKVTENGGTSTTYHVFAFDGDKLYAGLGSAGILVGDGAFVCASGKYYELSGGTCTEWKKSMFDKWESKPGDCTLTDGTFKAGSSTLETVGKVLVTTQMKNNKVEKHADFDAAKAAVPAK